MSEDTVVAALVGVLLVCLATTVLWSLSLRFRRRELQHREWMAALEKGMPLPELALLEASVSSPRIYLLKGLVWLACGLTLSVFLGALWLTTWDRPAVSTQIRDAQQLRELGYSPQEIRGLFPVNPGLEPAFPGGLCLLGLVPAGVGAAYLIFYRGEIKRAR